MTHPAVQIFLCYTRADEKRVKNLYANLVTSGFHPWMDMENILPGEIWKSAITKGIKKSDFFLACLSQNSVDKRGVIQEEIKEALEIWRQQLADDIFLIPVRLEECQVPELLSSFQWVNLYEENGWRKLLNAINEGIRRRLKKNELYSKEANQIVQDLGDKLSHTIQHHTESIETIEEFPDSTIEQTKSNETAVELNEINYGNLDRVDPSVIDKIRSIDEPQSSSDKDMTNLNSIEQGILNSVREQDERKGAQEGNATSDQEIKKVDEAKTKLLERVGWAIIGIIFSAIVDILAPLSAFISSIVAMATVVLPLLSILLGDAGDNFVILGSRISQEVITLSEFRELGERYFWPYGVVAAAYSIIFWQLVANTKRIADNQNGNSSRK